LNHTPVNSDSKSEKNEVTAHMKNRFTIYIMILLLLPMTTAARRMWGEDGIFVGASKRINFAPHIKWENDGILFFYTDYDYEGNSRAMVQVVNNDGTLEFDEAPLNISLDDASLVSVDRKSVFPDGNDGVYLVWSQAADSNRFDIMAQHLDNELNLLWQEGGTPVYRNVTERTARKSLYFLQAEDEGVFMVFHKLSEMAGQYERYNLHILKLNEEGQIADNWQEEGRPILEDNRSMYYIYGVPGDGVWIYIRREERTIMNKILPDGSLLSDEFFQMNIPDDVRIDEIKSDYNSGLFISYPYDDRIAIQHFNEEGQSELEPENAITHLPIPRGLVEYYAIIPDETGERVYVISSWDFSFEEMINRHALFGLYEINDEELDIVWEVIDLNGIFVEFAALVQENALLFGAEFYFLDDDDWQHINLFNVISENGRFEWGREGVEISEDGSQHELIDVLPSENGGVYIMAYDYLLYSVYSLDSEGEFAWDSRFVRPFPRWSGKLVATQMMNNQTVRLIYKYSHLLYYQLLHPNGNVEFQTGCRYFANIDSGGYENPKYTTSNHNLAIQWQDYNYDNRHKYLRFLDEDGGVHPEEYLDISDLIGEGSFIEMVGDSAGGFFLIFREGQEENSPYRLLHLSVNGDVDENPIVPFPELQTNRFFLVPENGGFNWAWTVDERGNIFLQKINDDLVFQWEEPRELIRPDFRGDPYRLVPAGEDNLIFLFTYQINDPDSSNVLALQYDTEGEAMWDWYTAAFDSGIGYRYRERNVIQLQYASRNDGGIWLCVYCGYYIRLKLQLLSIDGERMLGDRGVDIPRGVELGRPYLQSDNDDGLWLFWWMREEDGIRGVRALHLDADGDLINEDAGWTGSAAMMNFPGSCQDPRIDGAFSYDDGSAAVIFNIRQRSYDTNYRAQRFTEEPDRIEQIDPVIPHVVEFEAIYPSPSNSQVNIEYRLSHTSGMKLSIYSLNGREVIVIYDGYQFNGLHRETVDVSALPSGLYFIKLKTSRILLTQKVIQIK